MRPGLTSFAFLVLLAPAFAAEPLGAVMTAQGGSIDATKLARDGALPSRGDLLRKQSPDDKSQKPADAPPNPLNQFLARWMTSQDYALLKPGLQPAAPGAAISLPQSGPAATGLFTGRIAVPVRGDGAPSAAERGVLAPKKPAENPYLEAMNEPGPFSTLTPPSPTPVVTPPVNPSPAALVQPATLPPPPPQSKIPEFAKPALDDKYFKPLKRF